MTPRNVATFTSDSLHAQISRQIRVVHRKRREGGVKNGKVMRGEVVTAH